MEPMKSDRLGAALNQVAYAARMHAHNADALSIRLRDALLDLDDALNGTVLSWAAKEHAARSARLIAAVKAHHEVVSAGRSNQDIAEADERLYAALPASPRHRFTPA